MHLAEYLNQALKIKGSEFRFPCFFVGGKTMFQKFYPHKTSANVFELDKDFYSTNNIKAVIFDIDNTLVTHDTKEPPKEILDYFKFLEDMGIKIAIASNNHRERVETFSKKLGYTYVWRAWKPFKKNLKRLKKEFDVLPNEICLVGDQIFTDIYGGLRMGFYTVLVTAVGKSETKFVAFKRIFENLVMKEYAKNHTKK
jgi:HAD superfamily phosphatase (TIGR01668 family)